MFVEWCKTDALPYWAATALRPSGGVHEFLYMDGTPVLNINQRMRVQARFAYVYAHAGALGWYKDARKISDHAWNYLIGVGSVGANSISETGYEGCAHLLGPDDQLYDGGRDTYAQAFVILAGAWRYIAFKDEASLQVATDTLRLLDTYMAADNGGYLEGYPASLPRRQNPHMHLFEALLAMYDATMCQEYLKRAGEIYTLFTQFFFDKETGTIIEYFNEDWSRASNHGGPVEPGHMAEWCWLLREYEARTKENVGNIADQLYGTVLEIGCNKKTGFICDILKELPARYRTWPQTEWIKASLVQERAGYPGAGKIAADTTRAMLNTYLNVPEKGGWGDQLDADGEMISSTMPTSTFYHLFCAAAEVQAFKKFN